VDLLLDDDDTLMPNTIKRIGIPTWAEFACQVHSDAPNGLSNANYQVAHAREYREVQELTIAECGDLLSQKFPKYYRTKLLGASAYRLLAGDRAAARKSALRCLRHKATIGASTLLLLSFLPLSLGRNCFVKYRDYTGVPA
jgi:hypothetical protein